MVEDFFDGFWSNGQVGALRFPTARIFSTGTSGEDFSNLVGNLCSNENLFVIDLNVSKLHRTLMLVKNLKPKEIIYINGEPGISGLMKEYIERKSKKFDTIVAIGGGATIDSAKFFKKMQLETLQIYSHLIAIPTLPGSGAEVSRNMVYTDKLNRKTASREWLNAPNVALLDQGLFETCPNKFLILGALDAYLHLFEPLTLSKERNTIADSYILRGSYLISDALKVMSSDKTLAISKLIEASILGGDMASNFRTGLIHTFGETLHFFDSQIKHPVTLAIFYQAVMELISSRKDLLGAVGIEILNLFTWDMWLQYFQEYEVIDSIEYVRKNLRLINNDEIIDIVKRDSVILKEFIGGLNINTLHDIIEKAKND